MSYFLDIELKVGIYNVTLDSTPACRMRLVAQTALICLMMETLSHLWFKFVNKVDSLARIDYNETIYLQKTVGSRKRTILHFNLIGTG